MPLTVGQYTPTVDPGMYQATITACTEETSKVDQSHYRRWEFTLDDGRTVYASSSMAFSSKSKAGEWVQNILGRALVKGEDIEPVGMRCTINVIWNEDGYERITGVFAPQGAAPRRGPTPAVADGQSDPTPQGDDLPF